jgi:hypothetical protein
MHGEGSEGFEFNTDTKQFAVTNPLQHRNRQGCMTQRKVRKVCEKHCNNGWMSRAVDAAKPIARELILGRSFSLDRSSIEKLATWLAITTVMQEFAVTGTIVIPQEDRTILMETNRPPDHWTIWIGCYGGQNWHPMGHLHMPMHLSNLNSENSSAKADIPDCDLQLTTFTMRQMLTHVFTAVPQLGLVDEYREFVRSRGWNLVQLWPVNDDMIIWPRPPILDDELSLLLRAWAIRWGVDMTSYFRRQHRV